jgi:hypothetical protein
MNKFIRIIAVGICTLGTILLAPVGAIPRPVSPWGPPAPVNAPEIDAGAAPSAIGLLACGVLILAAKRKKT